MLKTLLIDYLVSVNKKTGWVYKEVVNRFINIF